MGNTDLKMQANVYKVNEDYSTFEAISRLKRKGMQYKKNLLYDSSMFRLFLKDDPRNKNGWVSSLEKAFSMSIDQEPGKLLRGIILITTLKNIYIAIYGYSRSYIDDIIDPSFGLDFAAKSIKDYQIEAKNVDYLQKNTLRSSINYKKDRFELPQANEAFFGIVGSPTNLFFGKKINCKEGINFTKPFGISNGEFFNLFPIIDQTMQLNDEISIPRLKRIKSDTPLVRDLNKKLLNQIQGINCSNIDMSFNIPYLHNLDQNITDLDSNFFYQISYRVEETNEYLSEHINLDMHDIQEFLSKYPQITNLEDIKISMYDGVISSDHKIRDTKLIRLILSEVTIDDKLYLLQNGYWGNLNSSFLTVMNDQLDVIENYIDSNGKKLVEYARTPNASYNIYNKDFYSDPREKNYAGENGYIETILRLNTPRVIKLHKRLVHGKGVKNEIADFYDTTLKELFAVKMGTSSGDCVYSFEQSIVSMYLLRNKKTFNVSSELEKYNDHNKYSSQQVLPKKIIQDIQKVKKSSVLWVIPESKNLKVNKKIVNNTFAVRDIGSFIVKLKLIEWFNTCQQNGFDPKLIMVDSNETLCSLPNIPSHDYFKKQVQGNKYYN